MQCVSSGINITFIINIAADQRYYSPLPFLQARLQCILGSIKPLHVRGEGQVAESVVPGGAGDYPAHVQRTIPAPVSLQVPPSLHR